MLSLFKTHGKIQRKELQKAYQRDVKLVMQIEKIVIRDLKQFVRKWDKIIYDKFEEEQKELEDDVPEKSTFIGNSG